MIRRLWRRLLGRSETVVMRAPTTVELTADVTAFIEGMLRARDAGAAMPLLWEGDQA